jgi:hypothetical protein
MGRFDDNEVSRNAASSLADEMRALTKETNLTVEVLERCCDSPAD